MVVCSKFREAWVTFGADDGSFTDLVVLANSIRKSGSSRQILLLVGPQVSKGIRVKLQHHFDGLFSVAGNSDTAFITAKIYCWSLTLFKRVVFIHPASIAVKYADDIFQLDNSKTFCAQGGSELLVISPDQGIHCELVEGVGASGADGVFKEFLRKRLAVEILEDKFHASINRSSTSVSPNSAIITFLDKVPTILENFKGEDSDVLKILNAWIQEANEIGSANAMPKHFSTGTSEPIAIVGMSCRFPGANNPEEFWELMMSGREVIRPVPEDRWRTDQSCIVDAEGRKIQAGFLNCAVDEFDGEFFGMSPMELSYTDPQHRFLLQLAWEALEDAGINPDSLKGSNTSAFTGSWVFDYKDLMTECGFRGQDFFRTYMGNSSSAGASRLAHFFCWNGVNISPESGCSTSIVALGMAMEALRKGATNLALVGGANLLLRPFFLKNWGMVISPDFQCKTFDASANGYARAEGCSVIAVKRLSDAIREGDRIHAIVRGYGMSQEGLSSSMGRPTVAGESLAMRLALEDGDVDPLSVSYIEAHGTGTSVGDPIEIQAIGNVYGGPRPQPLLIASSKTNVGHTEACSGLVGIIKTILAFKKGLIPAHKNLRELNPKIKLAEIPAIIPQKSVEWKGDRRMAGVSSFGITGTDAHVVLEEPPATNSSIFKKCPSPGVLTISAKSVEGLEKLLDKYAFHLEQDEEEGVEMVGDVAYTANVGRAKLPYRAAIIENSCEGMAGKIRNREIIRGHVKSDLKNRKVCFLYLGRSVISHYYKMGKGFYESSPVFRRHFEECEEILGRKFGISVKSAFWGNNEDSFDQNTFISHPAIFTVQYCLTKLWESVGISPGCVMGHSLGEFCAATVAGLMTLEEGLTRIVTMTALTDAKTEEGEMLAVMGEHNLIYDAMEEFDTICKSNSSLWLDIAAVNSSQQVTVAGSTESMKSFVECCTKRGVRTRYLGTKRVYHSRLMDPMLAEYKAELPSIKRRKPTCEYISGVDGVKIPVSSDQTAILDDDYWSRQLRGAVQYQKACEEAYKNGYRVFIEIGAQPVLASLLKLNVTDAFETPDPIGCSFSMNIKTVDKEWSTFVKNLAELHVKEGVDVDWKAFYEPYSVKKVTLPTYPFKTDKHWFKATTSTPSSQRGTVSSSVAISQNAKEGAHPILGSRFDTAASNTLDGTIFQGDLHLSLVSYVADHNVGGTVVFPGAGYIEMFFAAGFEQYPGQIVELKDILMSSPLIWRNLEDSRFFNMQTVLKKQSDSNKVLVYSKRGDDADYTWTLNCKATLKLEESLIPTSSTRPKLDEIQKRLTESSDSDEIYEKLDKFGYNFGPIFRSLKGIKRNPKDVREILVEIEVPSDASEYVGHPVILDGMLQSSLIALHLNTGKLASLQLPVSIKLFKWIKKGQGSIYFIHCCPPSTDETTETVTLFDENGSILATMNGLEFLSSSVQQLKTFLEDSSTHDLSLYEEKWTPRDNLLMVSSEFKGPGLNKFSPEMCQTVLELEMESRYELEEKKVLDKAIGLAMLRALIQIEMINPKRTSEYISLENYISRTNSSIGHFTTRMFARYFFYLQEDGFLAPISDGIYKWNPAKSVPDMQILSREIDALSRQLKQGVFKIDWELTLKCLENLPAILKHSITPLQILFPLKDTKASSQEEVSAELFYHSSGSFKHVHDMFERLIQYLTERRISDENTPLRILEIGAGTGGATKRVLPLLEKSLVPFKYTFTDLSSAFFLRPKKEFKSASGEFEFKVLNIEEDPLAQGFIPESYDLVVAANVIHATSDLAESSKHIRQLMKRQGLFLLLETLIPQRYLDVPFGLLEGYWRLGDPHLRTKSCVISELQWEGLLKNQGFGSVVSLKSDGAGDGLGIIVAEASSIPTPTSILKQSSNQTWLCFEEGNSINPTIRKRMALFNRQVLNVRQGTVTKISSDASQEDIATFSETSSANDWEQLLNKVENIEGIIFMWGLNQDISKRNFLYKSYFLLTQAVLKRNKAKASKKERNVKMFLITKGMAPTGDLDPELPTASTLFGVNRTLQNEQPDMIVRTLDLDPDDDNISGAESILREIWNSDNGEHFVAIRNRKPLSPNLELVKQSGQPLSIPDNSQYYLKLPRSKVIADLKFESTSPSHLKDFEVEVEVRAASLNFRDLLSVIKPTAQFEPLHAVCTDFAGVVTRTGDRCLFKVGDAVLGNNRILTRAMPSHVTIPGDELIPLPQNLTFAEGSTFATALVTAFHCLLTVAKMSIGQTVLIHTGSGGVGLFAIQLAFYVGANVISTAGSRVKRNYLKNLGVKHVFNSRDVGFKEKVMQVTDGNGVDIVLNSLTGPGFKEASLDTLKKNGYFIEMSKLNVWTNSEVASTRPDVHYSVEDLSLPDTPRWISIMKEMNKLIQSGTVRPLPYTRFSNSCIREALNFLKEAKHIGKVVLTYPQQERKRETQHNLLNKNTQLFSQLFNDRSTYLVTGGCGGLGLAVIDWMVNECGAKHLVLCGRSEPNRENEEIISKLIAGGKNIHVVQADLSNVEQCRRLIETANGKGDLNLPPLRGIIHCAGVISDKLMDKMEWRDFEQCLEPKVDGTWNLHELTKGLSLEMFVCFSSVSALLGTPGQSNYAGANSFMDFFTWYRRSLGLPACSINWGPWVEVGMAKQWVVPGLPSFTNRQGLNGLGAALVSQKPQLVVGDIEPKYWNQRFPALQSYLEKISNQKKAAPAPTNKTEPTTSSNENNKPTVSPAADPVSNSTELQMTPESFWKDLDSAPEEKRRMEILEIYVARVVANLLQIDISKFMKSDNFEDLGLDSLMTIELRSHIQNLLGERASLSLNALADCNTLSLITNTLFKIMYANSS